MNSRHVAAATKNRAKSPFDVAREGQKRDHIQVECNEFKT
jgi:hypothetical protein